VERALAKRPEDRFRTGAEMRDALMDRSGGDVYAMSQSPIVERQPVPEARRFPPGYPRPLAPPPAPPMAPPIAPPVGLSRRERRDWYRDQRHAYRDAVRFASESPEGRIAGKISRFRRSLLVFAAIGLMLLIINAANGGFPWFIFPVLGFVVALAGQLGSLWGDGVPFRDILVGPVRRPIPGALPEVSSGPPQDPVSQLAARDVLDGVHGAPIRRAADSRRIIQDLLRRTTPKEREMLPADLETTVNALVDRVASVAVTLHRLDSDANGTSLGTLDRRIESLKLEMQTPEQERRLSLLDRQRSTLRDLMERRSALLSQLESASLALENLKLDLVRFRSAGVSSALEDVTSATREARAVSRDIGHLLDAQDELKKL
jgi:serine/threonine-protein kinase